MSLRDLYQAVTSGLFGGRRDPITGMPYHVQDAMPEATLTQCRHWVNYSQASPQSLSVVSLLLSVVAH